VIGLLGFLMPKCSTCGGETDYGAEKGDRLICDIISTFPMKRILTGFLVVFGVCLLSAPGALAGEEGFRYGRDPKIEQVRPEKPVRIKLKRGAKGDYTWELSGDDVDAMIEADRKLREYLKDGK
jgi:hypothetical protein